MTQVQQHKAESGKGIQDGALVNSKTANLGSRQISSSSGNLGSVGGQTPVPNNDLCSRVARVAVEKVGIWETIKALLSSFFEGEILSLDDAKQTAVLSLDDAKQTAVANGIAKQLGANTLNEMANNAGSLLFTGLNQTQFNIVQKMMSADKDTLSKFKESLRRGIDEALSKLKNGTLSKEARDNFFKNVSLIENSSTLKDIISDENLQTIKTAETILKSNLSEEGALALIRNPEFAIEASRRIDEAKGEVRATLIQKNAADPADADAGASEADEPAAEPTKPADAADLTDAAGASEADEPTAEPTANPIDADAGASEANKPAATPTADPVDAITKLSTKYQLEYLAYKAEPEGGAQPTPIEELLNRPYFRRCMEQDAQVREALIQLYGNNKDAFHAYCKLADYNPDALLRGGVIKSQNSTIILKLATLIENFKNPDVKNAMIEQYMSLIENNRSNLYFAERFLEFAEILKEFITPELMEATAKDPCSAPNTLKALMGKCESQDLKEELAKLLSSEGIYRCFLLKNILQNRSENVSMELIDLCKDAGVLCKDAGVYTVLENAADLSRLSNVKFKSAESLLKACIELGEKGKNLVDLANTFSKTEIDESLVEKLAQNPETYQVLANLRQKIPHTAHSMSSALMQKCIENLQSLQKFIELISTGSTGNSIDMNLLEKCIENPRIIDFADSIISATQASSRGGPSVPFEKAVNVLQACVDYPDGAERIQKSNAMCIINRINATFEKKLSNLPALIRFFSEDKGHLRFKAMETLLPLKKVRIPKNSLGSLLEILDVCANHENAINNLDSLNSLNGSSIEIDVTPELVQLLSEDRYCNAAKGLLTAAGMRGIEGDKLTVELIKLCAENEQYLETAKK
jgi:hypothetical protein